VWGGLDCTAEGSLGAGRSLEEADRNLEEVHRIAVVADCTAAVVAGHTVAVEVGRRRSSHRIEHGHREQHRQALPECHRGKAASLRSLMSGQK
jgi:hypothetical protein